MRWGKACAPIWLNSLRGRYGYTMKCTNEITCLQAPNYRGENRATSKHPRPTQLLPRVCGLANCISGHLISEGLPPRMIKQSADMCRMLSLAGCQSGLYLAASMHPSKPDHRISVSSTTRRNQGRHQSRFEVPQASVLLDPLCVSFYGYAQTNG